MKLFASDFDGTFYFWSKDKKVFHENVQAVKEFQKENKFAVVTGRSPQSIINNLKSTDLKCDYIAGYNGGIVCDQNLNILYEDHPELDVYKILELLENEEIKSFSFFADKYMYVKCYDRSIRNYSFMFHYAYLNNKRCTFSLNKVKNTPILMATLVCRNDEQARKICERIDNLHMKCTTYMNHNCIDITGLNSSKQKAVEIIGNHMKADEIYVIGDSYNDLSMIEYYNGFTLAHANEEIKKKAHKVVKSVSEAIYSILHE